MKGMLSLLRLKIYSMNTTLLKCPEKENFALQVFELGIILKDVFPDVNRVQRRVKGART